MKKQVRRKEVRSTVRSVPARQTFVALSLALIGLIAYWNSFDVPFVFDDLVSIETNTGVQFGDSLNLSSLWSRSVLYFTFAANRAFGGQNVWGYHFVNLLLHVLNSVLIYFLARRIFSGHRPPLQQDLKQANNSADWFAFFAAAFFLLHPVQTESVTYISSRSELLSTLFYLSAVLLFARRPPDRIGFVFSVIIGALFVIGLGAKETVISLPMALLVYDFVFFSNASVRSLLPRWRFYAPFFVGGIAAGLYLATVTLRASIGASSGNLPAYHYFLTELRVIVRYLQITFFPSGLNLAYDFAPSTSFTELRVLMSASLLAGLLFLGWFSRRRIPIVAFSILWFFVTLAPTSSFISIRDVIFEHRLYLPLAGMSILFPFFVTKIQRLAGSHRGFQMAGAIVLLALLIGTIARNEVWRDDVRLWSDAIAKAPGGARGYQALALVYYRRGQYDKAIEVTRQAMDRIKEDSSGADFNIGQFCLGIGQYDQALEAFSKAIERSATSKDRSRAEYNLAVTYLYQWNALKQKKQQMEESAFLREQDTLLTMAEAALLKSIDSDEKYLPSWDSYMNVAVDLGKQEALRNQLRQQIDKTPGRALYGLGKLAFQEAKYGEAADYFKQAVKFYSGEEMFWFNYAYALEEVGDVDGAIDKYIRALRIDPLFMQAHHNLGQIYMDKGLTQPAVEHFNQVLRSDPKSTVAHLQLARIFIQQGQRALARNHLSAVLNLSPGDPDAVALWQQTGS